MTENREAVSELFHPKNTRLCVSCVDRIGIRRYSRNCGSPVTRIYLRHNYPRPVTLIIIHRRDATRRVAIPVIIGIRYQTTF